jgi:hypothetical protein
LNRNLVNQITANGNRMKLFSEQCVIKLDKTLIAGKYDLLISMRDECGFHNTSIQLAIKKERETVPGWYKLGEVLVSQ